MTYSSNVRGSRATASTSFASYDPDQKMSPEEFSDAMQQIGDQRYHNLHPFHKMLHGGELNHGQVQAWALNRYYYQASIPIKDLTLMARMPASELRRAWRSRVLDHDGVDVETGGISRYLQLTDRLGLERDYVISTDGILPATRYAVDAYINFVTSRTLLEAIASSLTELFAPAIHRERIKGLSKCYEWADEYALAYFKKRLNEAPKDAKFGKAYVIREARNRDQQELVLKAIRFKTDILWAQLDALSHAYVNPVIRTPDTFDPANYNFTPVDK